MNNKLRNSILKAAIFTTPVIGLLLLPYQALAGSQIFDGGPDTCTTTNCNASVLNGTYDFGPFNNANPFVLQVFSTGGECVRIDVTSEGTDLEAVLVSPNGTIWRNDDRNGALDRRPLVKAITPAGVRGWYTLQISQFSGVGPYADFTVAYGRYNSTNPNCSGATPPSFAGTSELNTKPNLTTPPLPGGTIPKGK